MKKIIILVLALASLVSAQTEKLRVVLVTQSGYYQLDRKVEPLLADALKALNYRVFIIDKSISNQANYNDSNVNQVKELIRIIKEFEPNFVLLSSYGNKNSRSTSIFGVTTYYEILNGKFFAVKPDGELIKNWAFDAEGVGGTRDSAVTLSLQNLVNRSIPFFQEAFTPR
jgi:hypothetical protein